MNFCARIATAAAVMLLTACQTAPDMRQLQSENAALHQKLADANSTINELRSSELTLQQEKAELNRVIGVLGHEKSSRVTESADVRARVRSFVQGQIDSLKSFLLHSNLLDYVGSELLARETLDKTPVLMVDLANPAPADGLFTSVGGVFQQPGSLTVKVLRQLEGKLVVVWESNTLTVPAAGMQQINFAVSVGVLKGDFFGYRFHSPGMVGFDTGTGDSRYLEEDLTFGQNISLSSLDGEDEKRAYSIGAYGLLNTD